MKLCDNKQDFSDIILRVSKELDIYPSLVEKDYYVNLFLNVLNKRIQGLLFKGGTSLSKCYKIIDRFSEDIDLTLDNEHFSQSKKRKANKAIIEACDELGFTLSNREWVENHSHGNYNVYIIEYPLLFPFDYVKPFIKIEMVFMQKAYPNEIQNVDSYIGSWLINNGYENLANKYDLRPFPIHVQTLERTLIDKVFAICDYYLKNETERNSRHIYDIYKILTKIQLDDKLSSLVNNVRDDRKNNLRRNRH